MRLLPLSIALGLSLAALPALAQRGRTPPPPPAPTACTDFHAFTNRAWLQANPASAAQPERSRLGLLTNEAQQKQQALFDAAVRAPATAEERLLGDFWAAGLDEAGLDRRGPEALREALAPLSQFRRPRDLPQVAAAFHRKGLFPMAEFVRLEDSQGSGRPLAAVPTPLGLADPAFYLSTEAEAPKADGFDIAGWSKPADETGGDCYDFFPLANGHLAVTIADLNNLRDEAARLAAAED